MNTNEFSELVAACRIEELDAEVKRLRDALTALVRLRDAERLSTPQYIRALARETLDG